MLALGSGFGLAIGSPSARAAETAATYTVAAGVWLIVTQWVASGFGGYITGRLRVRWIGTHTHEVFFRDTANGFLAWAVATVLVFASLGGAALLTAYAASQRPEAVARGADSASYAVSTLFRSPRPDDTPSATAVRAEAATILARQAALPNPSGDDRAYLMSLVEGHAGVDAATAAARVDAAIANTRDAADKARKAASATSIVTALALLIGALTAAATAALGGRLRDEHL
jgi:hypothetical protein